MARATNFKPEALAIIWINYDKMRAKGPRSGHRDYRLDRKV